MPGSVSASGVPATSAGRNDARTSGQNDHHVTVIQADINPCTGDTGTLTQIYNDADPVPAPVDNEPPATARRGPRTADGGRRGDKGHERRST
jgi:hypothetical protein